MASVNLRKDSYHAQESIGELQHLISVASNTKEELDYTSIYLKRSITRLGIKIKNKRQNFIKYLDKCMIDPEMFPIISDVLSDDIYQDTEPAQALSITPVESALYKNFPLKEFSDVIDGTKVDGIIKIINERIDELKKLKLHKATLECLLQDINEAKKQYIKNEKDHGDDISSTLNYNFNLLNLYKSQIPSSNNIILIFSLPKSIFSFIVMQFLLNISFFIIKSFTFISLSKFFNL